MKKIICIVLTLVLLCGSFTIVSVAASNSNEIDSSLYYAKAQLATLDNGEALVNAYEKIEEGVKNCVTKITIYDEQLPVTPDEVRGVYDAFINDQPQHFHLNREEGFSTYYNPDTGIASAIEVSYTLTGKDYEKANAKFEKAADKILSKIPENLSEYETELAIHNALVKHIDYTTDADYAHEAYGALVYGKAVCDGYARSFQYLLYKRGIQALMIPGAVAETDGSFSGHAWNLVRIDGEYYYTDVTHNDPVLSNKPKLQVYHNYFNLTTVQMFRDRVPYDTVYSLPECTAIDNFYFNHSENSVSDAFSVEEVAAKLAQGNGVAHIYAGNVSNYGDWFVANFASIYSLTGIKNADSYMYSAIDGEYIFMIRCTNDINCDGGVNAADALVLKQGLVGMIEFSEANILNGESNDNGVIDPVDYLNLKLTLLK